MSGLDLIQSVSNSDSILTLKKVYCAIGGLHSSGRAGFNVRRLS